MIRSRTTDDGTRLAKDAKWAKGWGRRRPSSSPFHRWRDLFGFRAGSMGSTRRQVALPWQESGAGFGVAGADVFGALAGGVDDGERAGG
jgi:hypothetical protein